MTLGIRRSFSSGLCHNRRDPGRRRKRGEDSRPLIQTKTRISTETTRTTSGNANISSRPVRHRTEPMEPRRSGSVHLRMEMPVSIQRASETSRAREIDLAHAGFWYLGAVRPSRAGACAPTTLEPTVESGQTVEGGPRRCTLRTETTSPLGPAGAPGNLYPYGNFPLS
ncbi:hypothetical protein BC628DRAFT_134042 [Trametes gibbosa]|nr:hypothetical protein BC628DRAFT_134042 [Trametes gibbosa]